MYYVLFILFTDSEHSSDDHEPPKSHTDAELEEMIDPILKEMDKDGDGYVEYHEYKSSNV